MTDKIVFKCDNNNNNNNNNNIIDNNNDDDDIGYVLSYNDELGRILISTKEYNKDDIILQEKPLLIYNNLIELVLKSLELSSKDKELLYDMHYKDLPIFEECINFMKESFNSIIDDLIIKNLLQNSDINIDDIYKLISISNFNSHNFIGSNSIYDEITNQSKFTNKRTALFYLGSKLSHACDPNCSYTSKVIDDVLIYRAIKPIKVGDILSFSYINSRLCTKDRRSILMKEKDFFCKWYEFIIFFIFI